MADPEPAFSRIISDDLIRGRCFESGIRESRSRGQASFRCRLVGLRRRHTLGSCMALASGREARACKRLGGISPTSRHANEPALVWQSLAPAIGHHLLTRHTFTHATASTLALATEFSIPHDLPCCTPPPRPRSALSFSSHPSLDQASAWIGLGVLLVEDNAPPSVSASENERTNSIPVPCPIVIVIVKAGRGGSSSFARGSVRNRCRWSPAQHPKPYHRESTGMMQFATCL